MSNLTKLNEWKEEHPERVKENDKKRVKRWRANNPEKWKAQNDRSNRARTKRGYYEENKEYLKNRYLNRKYGITLEEYNDMLAEQEGRCAICQVDSCPSGKAFAVDHDKETGKIRGLLCKNCNIGIGMFFHKTKLLETAKIYLCE